VSVARPSALAERLVVVALVGALLAYAAVALWVRQWWLSGLAAPVAAALLAVRHPRARFSAYVLLTVVAVRGATAGDWSAAAFAVAAILALQAPPALRVWPRVRPPARMARP